MKQLTTHKPTFESLKSEKKLEFRPPAQMVAIMEHLASAVKRSSLEETLIADISRVSKSEVVREIFDNIEVEEIEDE